ncbi:MAG: O-antigen ligase family protein [Patescibacteria group bacterium]
MENNKFFNLILIWFCLALLGGNLLILILPGVGKASILDLAVLVMVLLGLWQLRHSKLTRLPLIIWSAGLFILLATISLLGSLRMINLPEMLVSGLFLVRWVVYAGLFIWAYALNRAQRNSTFNFIGVTLGLVVLLGLVQLIIFPNLGFWERLGWDPHQNRLVSTFLDPNLLGGFLVVGLVIPLRQWFNPSTKTRWRWLWLLIIILINLAVFLTYSRSALLALIVFWLIVGWRYWRVALMGLLLVGLVVLISPRLQTRVGGIFNIDVTAQHRLDSWQDALTIIKQEPILGVGYNTLPYTKARFIYQPQSRAYSGFDSSLLTIATTTGALGLAAYLGMVMMILIGLIKIILAKRQFLALGVLASTMALIVNSLFVNSWLYTPVLALWWVILGLALSKNISND